MTHETEVIDSVHMATETGMTSNSRRSPLYHDTTPEPETRKVRFYNKATFSDTSNAHDRRIRFGIGVNEDVSWGEWYNYTSPAGEKIFSPECEVTVPNDGATHHYYEITTEFELQQKEGTEWVTLISGSVGPYRATVNEE